MVSNGFWVSWVVLFSFSIKVFQLLVHYCKYWHCNHAIRIVDGTVIEMLAEGRVETPVDEWLAQRKRTVYFFKPLEPFREVERLPYGFLDIPQIVLHWLRLRLGIGHGWDGEDGIIKKLRGMFCSEEVGSAIGEEHAHRLLPCTLGHSDRLRYEFKLTTPLP